MSTRYDLGVFAELTTLPGVCWLPVQTHTLVSSGISASGLTLCRLSKSAFCLCLKLELSFRNFSRYGHLGMSVSAICGTQFRMTRPISSSAGGNGVALYDRSDRKGSLAFLSHFLTVFTPGHCIEGNACDV